MDVDEGPVRRLQPERTESVRWPRLIGGDADGKPAPYNWPGGLGSGYLAPPDPGKQEPLLYTHQPLVFHIPGHGVIRVDALVWNKMDAREAQNVVLFEALKAVK